MRALARAAAGPLNPHAFQRGEYTNQVAGLPGRQCLAEDVAVALAGEVEFRGEAPSGAAQGMVRGLRRAPLFAAPCCGARGTHHGGVDEEDVYVQLVALRQLRLERAHQAQPGDVLPPAHEPVIDGLPGPMARGQIASGSPGVQPPENAVENGAVVLPGPAPALARQQGLERPPLPLIQLVAHHAGSPPPGGNNRNTRFHQTRPRGQQSRHVLHVSAYQEAYPLVAGKGHLQAVALLPCACVAAPMTGRC